MSLPSPPLLTSETFRLVAEVQETRIRTQLLECVSGARIPLASLDRRMRREKGHTFKLIYENKPINLKDVTELMFLCGYRLEVDIVPLR